MNPNDKQIQIRTDDGIEKVLDVKNENDLPLLRNPTILIGQNDLTSLSYLHEPDVLHTLEARWVRFIRTEFISRDRWSTA